MFSCFSIGPILFHKWRKCFLKFLWNIWLDIKEWHKLTSNSKFRCNIGIRYEIPKHWDFTIWNGNFNPFFSSINVVIQTRPNLFPLWLSLNFQSILVLLFINNSVHWFGNRMQTKYLCINQPPVKYHRIASNC